MSTAIAVKTTATFRTDIQALRGLAVLLVVCYHAAPAVFQEGYLGVDIFFVISGYLITNLVKKGLETGEFSFSGFYWRRAKRLLPAAYCTLFTVALLSTFLLTRRELGAFRTQLIGAVTFTANLVLWKQQGYFEGEAQLKPLLHVWSLAIEEQYYLILPASLVFLPRRFWALGAGFVFAGSLALYLVFFFHKPVATFYLLPTRAWELALGSIAAISLDRGKYRRAVFASYPFALLMLLLIPFSPAWGHYTSLKAPVLCLAAMVFILRKKDFSGENQSLNLMAWFGGISYSLYLVHWPLFAFLNNSWVGTPPKYASGVCVVLSTVLAYLLFRFVETPVRHANIRLTARSVGGTLAVSVILMLTPFGILWATRNQPDFSQITRPNVGLDAKCDYRGSFEPIPACRTSETPSILVWGDSFGMHLMRGIAATSGNPGVIQATSSFCGPFEGLSVITKVDTAYNLHYAEACFDYNQDVLHYLSHASSVKVVVLSSPFSYYLDPDHTYLLQGRAREIDESADIVVSDMKRTVELVRSMGKRVVVVAPPPTAGIDLARCYERKMTGKLNLGPDSNCELRVSAYHEHEKAVLEFLRRLPGEAGVDVISFDHLLCDNDLCTIAVDGRLLYWDGGHLSDGGSEILAERMGLVSEIFAKAR